MKITPVVYELDVNLLRLLWWRHISFGWLPSIERGFYGGPTTVVTWWQLWVQWEV